MKDNNMETMVKNLRDKKIINYEICSLISQKFTYYLNIQLQEFPSFTSLFHTELS